MQRTDYTSEIDGALAGRNAGSEGHQGVARSGNGDMRTDLLADDCSAYTELEGLGETVEEMTDAESRAEDQGNQTKFQAFRTPKAGEKPPMPAPGGKFWIKRRIRMHRRKPGGNRLLKSRWVQVSAEKYQELLQSGELKIENGVPTLGFIDISSNTIKTLAIGAAVGAGLLMFMGRKKKAVILSK